MDFDFAEVLLTVMERNASDLHLTAGSPPMIRQHGKLHALDYPALTPQQTRDVAYSIPGKARYRVNAYFQRASLSAAFRLIPSDMPRMRDLGLPPVIHEFTK